MRVKMTPAPPKKITSGIDQVVHHYAKYLPNYGIEFVDANPDLWAVHIYAHPQELEKNTVPIVVHNHGLHWTDDYACDRWQYWINGVMTETIRHASAVTVPSAWVAETFQRDMRFTPHVIPHGIEWQNWEPQEHQGYVLWNKNRDRDVCRVEPVIRLAQRFQGMHFITTFDGGHVTPTNVKTIGLQPHDAMRQLIQSSMVYLSTTKETFGIGVLEAMASGVPVLGWRYGGNTELIEHGVNGYLATPEDYEDLAAGMDYCTKHRDTLGANGREMSKRWTWERAAEMVAEVYKLAIEPEPATVGVVIPVYNKSVRQLERAVESVIHQTQQPQRVVIIDDGSKQGEDYQGLVAKISQEAPNLTIDYIRQNNSGVAVARNRGADLCTTKYICCLDSDDAIRPDFIKECVRELEADPSLGIVYTKIEAVTPDGKKSVSQWPPDEPDYDAQMQRKNQIPTCCVFKREMWERLGGYRQRYAPTGAGAEDAEFWLRAMAYGYKAKCVKKPLFVYSLGSGHTSQEGYSEVPWTGWHPWVDGERPPFASLAKPSLFSHPVRQYDEPLISVIIPVGPGHEKAVINALDSLEAQTFRKWEAIVVWDAGGQYGTYPDEYTVELNMPEALQSLSKSYPYIRAWITGSGKMGAGYARNRGAEAARGEFLVFLDADDWLAPSCLEEMLKAWVQEQAIVYTDYINRSVVNEKYLAQIDKAGRLLATLKTVEKEGEQHHLAVYWSEAKDYDCQLAQAQPRLDGGGQFYTWCLVTTLIPKAWHEAIGGFDESMSSFEDVDYHWRLARAGYCYVRVPEQLVIYNYHLGHRRESGLQSHENLIQYISEKYTQEAAVGCSGCGGRNKRVAMQPSRSQATRVVSRGGRPQQVVSGSDDQWIMCRYTPGRRGSHQVTGSALFDGPLTLPGGAAIKMVRKAATAFVINYGYQDDGNTFLVHQEDIKAKPGYFQPLAERAVAISRGSPSPPPEPKQIKAAVLPMPEPLEMPTPLEMPELPPPPSILDEIGDGDPPEIEREPAFNLQKLPGIGGKLAAQLEQDGIVTVEDVLNLGSEGLQTYDGVGKIKAGRIIKAIQARQ